MMTVAELIGLLEQYPQDAPVRIAIQPEYPLQMSVQGTCLSTDLDLGGQPAGGEDPTGEVVWVLSGDTPATHEPMPNPYVWPEMWGQADRV